MFAMQGDSKALASASVFLCRATPQSPRSQSIGTLTSFVNGSSRGPQFSVQENWGNYYFD